MSNKNQMPKLVIKDGKTLLAMPDGTVVPGQYEVDTHQTMEHGEIVQCEIRVNAIAVDTEDPSVKEYCGNLKHFRLRIGEHHNDRTAFISDFVSESLQGAIRQAKDKWPMLVVIEGELIENQ